MAATGYTPISLYYSTTASAVPTAGNLANGELALNIADMKLYAKNSAGTVTLLASNASTTGVDSLSFGSTGLTPSTATTGAITVAGTLNVANGGTGSTSLTAGRVLFGAGTSAVGNSANLFWDNSNSRLGIGTATPRGSIDAIGRSYFQASGSNAVLTLLNTSGGDGSITVTGTATTMNYGFSTFSTSDALYIQNNGNIGIGTSSPSSKLDVTATTAGNYAARILNSSATGYGIKIRNGNDSNDALRVSNAADTADNIALYGSGNAYFLGNVGFGTSSPAAKIHAVGTVRSSNSAGTIYTSLATDGIYSSGTDLYLLAPSGYSTLFYTNNTEKFRFGTAGQLGIGGANYGTSGQVLTSQGSGAAPTWSTAGGGTTMLFCAFSSTMGL